MLNFSHIPVRTLKTRNQFQPNLNWDKASLKEGDSSLNIRPQGEIITEQICMDKILKKNLFSRTIAVNQFHPSILVQMKGQALL